MAAIVGRAGRDGKGKSAPALLDGLTTIQVVTSNGISQACTSEEPAGSGELQQDQPRTAWGGRGYGCRPGVMPGGHLGGSLCTARSVTGRVSGDRREDELQLNSQVRHRAALTASPSPATASEVRTALSTGASATHSNARQGTATMGQPAFARSASAGQTSRGSKAKSGVPNGIRSLPASRIPTAGLGRVKA